MGIQSGDARSGSASPSRYTSLASADCRLANRGPATGKRQGAASARGIERRTAAMAASDGPGPETWEYDVLAVAETGGVSLRHIAFDIFAREGLVDAFGIPEERFKALLERLELLYSVENPYHCALHAAVRLRAPPPRTRAPPTRGSRGSSRRRQTNGAALGSRDRIAATDSTDSTDSASLTDASITFSSLSARAGCARGDALPAQGPPPRRVRPG